MLAAMFSAKELEHVVRIVRHELNSRAGKARAKKLTKKRRQEIARQAAQARWSKDRKLA